MTERRSHWDDALVYAVIHEIGTLRPSPHSLRDTAYAVIAAVEDWARWEHVPKGTLLRLERAEAAIARVREFLADKDEGLTDDARAQGHFILVDTDSVRRALDGDS